MSAARLHEIPRRDIQFDFSGVDLLAWHPGGPQNNHYFNVQSLQFPQGERFFIRSVRHFRDQITDPVLQQQIAGFIAQEATHGREHEAYNAGLGARGYPVQWMERVVNFNLWVAERSLSARMRLAMTAALEHLTAIGAEGLLEDERILGDSHPEMARLWRWHAMEEIEHKAVAFDVYRAVAGNGLYAWLRRCYAMLVVSLTMSVVTWLFMLRVSWRDGSFFNLRGWGALLWAMWGTPGDIRKQFPRYWQFFRPGFHPWQIDNYRQVERWRGLYASAPSALETP